MTRTITVVSTKDQKKHVFTTEATTVGELLTKMNELGIDYSGMVLYEAITKSEFAVNNVDGQLPHDVVYKGNTTNDLVFMLTMQEKNIKSGADRREVCHIIVTLGLQDAVKEAYGRNYTNVPTDALIAIIDAANAEKEDKALTIAEVEEGLVALMNILLEKEVISHQDIATILATVNSVDETQEEEKAVASPYSDDELEELCRR